MKKIFLVFCFIWTVMMLMPLTAIKNSDEIKVMAADSSKSDDNEISEEQLFSLLNKETGEVTKMSANDYVFGVVAAEMPASYETEALKAQAVAAYTYALRKKSLNNNYNYDISDDFSVDQSFITKEKAKEKWGDKADEYVEKIEKAVSDTAGYTVKYNNELANTVYHALSNGKTKSSKEVWNADIKYLQSVPSDWDKQAQDYKVKVEFSQQQLLEKFESSGVKFDETKEVIGKIEQEENKTVNSITVMGKEISRSEVREILNLRSSDFEITKDENGYTFTTYGYGHGVGMSQFGANEMAKTGSDFKEILTHYYTDCIVEK